MTNVPTKPFDWHEYLSIDPAMSPHGKKLVTQALDDLVAMRDGEGIDLILKVSERSGIKPYPIREVTNSASRAYRYAINLDFREIANFTVMENGEKKHLSVLGILTHELYHMGEDKKYGADVLLAVAQVLKDPQLLEETQAYIALLKTGVDSKTIDMGKDFPRLDQLCFDLMGGTAKFSPAQFKALVDMDIPVNFNKPEEDAVQYTNMLLKKNGYDEPLRSNYANGTADEQPLGADKAFNPKHHDICIPVAGFKAAPVAGAVLGTLDSPQVRPGCDAPPVRGR